MKQKTTIGECFICKRKLKRHEVSPPLPADVVAIKVVISGVERFACLKHPGVEELKRCQATTK